MSFDLSIGYSFYFYWAEAPSACAFGKEFSDLIERIWLISTEKMFCSVRLGNQSCKCVAIMTTVRHAWYITNGFRFDRVGRKDK